MNAAKVHKIDQIFKYKNETKYYAAINKFYDHLVTV